MLSKIKSARDGLRKSEQKVADVILADPDASVQSSIQAIATRAAVSEPTVIRFCRALDCVGFQQFKLRLAQDLASRGTFFYRDVTSTDTSKELADKLLDGAIASHHVEPVRALWEPNMVNPPRRPGTEDPPSRPSRCRRPRSEPVSVDGRRPTGDRLPATSEWR